jgi:hypothetical protein
MKHIDKNSMLRHRAEELKGHSEFRLSVCGRRSLSRLRSLHNTHVGKQCFVVGNGPSLRQTDLAPLRYEFTFGMNRVYLLFDELGFTTSVLTCVNRHVIEQYGDDFLRYRSVPRFLSWHGRHLVKKDPEVTLLPLGRLRRFSRNPIREIMWDGATVTCVSLQLAYWMGFQKVVLIGVDHNFREQGEPHQLIVSEGDDTNHFDPNYFGKGARWQLPDYVSSEYAYTLAREAFRRDGRQVVDATVNGRLDVFPKEDYEQAIAQRNG